MSTKVMFQGSLEPGERMPGPVFGVRTTVSITGSCSNCAILEFDAEMSQVQQGVPNLKRVSTQSLTTVERELICVEAPEDACGMQSHIVNTSGEKIRFGIELTVHTWAELEERRTGSAVRSLDASSPATAKAGIPDLKVWGDPDMLKLIAKASSESQGFMKTMKAVDLEGGVIVQFETQQRCYDSHGHRLIILEESLKGPITKESVQAENPGWVVHDIQYREGTEDSKPGYLISYTLKGTVWALSQSTCYIPNATIADTATDSERGVTERRVKVKPAAEAFAQAGEAFGQSLGKELSATAAQVFK